MIKHPAFAVEEWKIHETELNLDILAHTTVALLHLNKSASKSS